MVALLVKAGTPVTAIKHFGNGEYKHRQWITKAEQLFYREDITIDPINDLTDTSKENDGPIAIAFMQECGSPDRVYGFRRMSMSTGEREDFTMIVNMNNVEAC